MNTAAKLFSKWQDWIKNDLLRQFQNLIINQHIAAEFEASLKPFVGREVEWGDLVLWMSVNHIANTGSAIRRLNDSARDTISLRRLLEDVRKHAAVVTQENLSTYRGDIGPGESNVNVEEALDSDLRLLSTSGEPIRKFVNKMIAHNADDAHKITLPTSEEFKNAVHSFHTVYRKWALRLAGMNCQPEDPNPNDLLPMDLPDYRTQFTKMWNSLGKD
ncbi:MAG TPA: hypothetical protein VFF64_01270 [Candidatus Eremiobacteraceae bacterium]|nr:hypothetical protein [Candidatus Eremiobacteraceae bacterium]